MLGIDRNAMMPQLTTDAQLSFGLVIDTVYH